VGYKA